MVKAIVLHSVVPMRTDPKETAGQETQLLFAETCTVLEEQSRWLRVKNDADGSEGWVDRKMITPLSDNEWKQLSQVERLAKVKMPVAYAVSENNGQTLPLTAGTCLPNYQDGKFELLGVSFRIDSSMVATAPVPMNTENLMQTIRFFLNTPYLWGGKNALGMDCSGFAQIILSLFGCTLSRNASAQARQGKRIAERKLAHAGDLAFFDHEDGVISHVGIVLDEERVVHCSGRVKVEKMDDQGIWSGENGGEYTHHLVGINRYI